VVAVDRAKRAGFRAPAAGIRIEPDQVGVVTEATSRAGLGGLASFMRLRSLILVSLLLSACGGGGSATAPPAVATAPLAVYVTDAVGNLASVVVTVAELSLYDVSGHEVPLRPGPKQIDLVAAHDNPALLAVFGIPVGSYNRVRGAINVVSFTTVDHPERTCTFANNPHRFDYASDHAALVVTEAGLRITVDVPLDPHAECPANGAVGTLALRGVSVSLG
jgi:hypothetical protein